MIDNLEIHHLQQYLASNKPAKQDERQARC